MNIAILRRKGFNTSLRDAGISSIRIDKINQRINYDCILRWGVSDPLPLRYKFLEINKPEAIRKLANKPVLRKICEEAGIRVPKTFYTWEEAEKFVLADPKNVIIGRPAYHFAARNFHVSTNQNHVRVAGDRYWQQWVAKSNEYRVYVAFGKVLGVDEKIPVDPTQKAWNHSQGSRFTPMRWDNWPSKAMWFALKAAELSDIDVAAFDLIYCDGYYYLLEGNTAFSVCSDYKVAMLKKLLNWLQPMKELPAKPKLGEFVKGYRNYIHTCIGV